MLLMFSAVAAAIGGLVLFFVVIGKVCTGVNRLAESRSSASSARSC